MDWTQILPWALLISAIVGAAYANYRLKGVWREVAEAREATIRDMQVRISVLEAQVGVLTSDFARVIAEHVVEQMNDQWNTRK